MVEKTPNTNDGGLSNPIRRERTEDTVIEPRKIAGFTLVTPGDSEAIPIDAGSDAGSYSNPVGTTFEPRRRGRKPGSVNRPRETEAPSNIAANLDTLLFSVHLMLSQFIGLPELEIDATESKRLSDAVKNVSKHYSYNLDPKKLSIVELLCVAGGIYGPRVVAIVKRPRAVAAPGPKLVPRSAPVASQPQTQTQPKVMNPSEVWNETPVEDRGI